MMYVRPKELNLVPPTVSKVCVLTTGKFSAPKGWVESSGAMHLGRNKWIIPLKREDTVDE